MEQNIVYEPLQQAHFQAIVALGNFVHGDNYIDLLAMQEIYQKSFYEGQNASWVALSSIPKQNAVPSRCINEQYLVGFRLTLAAQQWDIDQWCSPELWSVPANKVCYFKCNTVDEQVRGQGIGKALLGRSIDSAKAQGAEAGLAHIWLASPNNSAFGYFSACGGKLVKEHPNKWQIHSIEDNFECPVCERLCTCTAAEMLLNFTEKS